MTEMLVLAQSNGGFAAAGGLMIVFIILAIVASVFWLWMLIDCLTSSMQPAEKVLWAVVILFLHLLGALIYFFVGRRGGRHMAA